MGVKGLWELLHPVARPIKLETLANKQLAIDASIWLHQFLRGMRDQEGQAIGNAHLIGFFRRICKLLFYNIKPIFIYDGGTPALKRKTIQERQRRKHHDVNQVKRTAEKLLAAQLRLHALEQRKAARKKKAEEKKAQSSGSSGVEVVHDSIEDPNYLDDIVNAVTSTAPEVTATGTGATTGSNAKRIKDNYVLPPMDTDFETLAKIRSYDERFGFNQQDDDDVNTFLNDFKREGGVANIDSDVFKALPSELQYEILHDIRLRSRVTSYERVQEMVRLSETPMDFSKLQVEGVIRRNTVTHKLLSVNQAVSKIGDETTAKPGRIASQRNRQYLLVKNEEGGWVLGGRKPTEGVTAERPVNLDPDEDIKPKKEQVDLQDGDEDQWESDDEDGVEFEEVKIPNLEAVPLYTPLKATLSPRLTTKVETPPLPAPAIPRVDSIIDHPEAYMDEDESIEKVMAKFAQLDNEQSSRRNAESNPGATTGLGVINDIDNKDHEAARLRLIQAGHSPDWPDVLSDNENSFETINPDQMTDYSAFDDLVEDENTGEIITRQEHDLKYNVDQENQAQPPNGRALSIEEENRLDQEAFFSYWTGHTAESFKNRNDNYEWMIRDAIFDWSEDDLEGEIHSATRKLDKSNVNDVDGIDALQFWLTFLTSVQSWRQAQELMTQIPPPSDDAAQLPELEIVEAERSPEKPKSRLSQSILFDDDEDEDEDERLTSRYESPSTQGLVTADQIIHSILQPATIAPLETSVSVAEETKADEGMKLDLSTSIFRRKPTTTVLSDITSRASTGSSTKTVVVDLDMETETETEDVHPVNEPEQKSEVVSDRASVEVTPGEVSVPVKVVDDLDDEVERDFDFALEELSKMGERVEEDDEEEQKDEDADEDEDEAHEVDLENEEHNFTQLFPEMATLPGAFVLAPKAPSPSPAPVLTAEEQAALDQQDATRMFQESRALESEIKILQDQRRKQQRNADDLTETMVADTQMLLKLFGIPYIVAPMEAEAQCADLQIRGVVDGILTEDSDVFLFGGMRVFKNMFKEEKYVECYLMSDIERDLGVGRNRLVELAYLLGSDYTPGIKGIGIVTAMEILRLFPKLENFAKWWRGELVKKDKPEDEAKAVKDSIDDEIEEDDWDLDSVDEIALDKLAKSCKKIEMPSSFPDPHIADAYIQPMVDDDPTRFQWGIPDLDGLRDYLRLTLGWDRAEVDRLLLPIIRQMSRAHAEGTQTTLDGFFDASVGTGVFQPPVRKTLHKSARLRKIVSGLTGGSGNGGSKDSATSSPVDSDTSMVGDEAPAKKTKKTPAKRKTATTAGSTGASKKQKKKQSQQEDGEEKSGAAEGAAGEAKEADGPAIVISDSDSDTAEPQKRARKVSASSSRTAQLRVPEAVTAAKKQLQSKNIEVRLAARKKMQEEEAAAAAASATSPVASSASTDLSRRRPRPNNSDTSSSGSDSEEVDDDFAPSHWDLLAGKQSSRGSVSASVAASVPTFASQSPAGSPAKLNANRYTTSFRTGKSNSSSGAIIPRSTPTTKKAKKQRGGSSTPSSPSVDISAPSSPSERRGSAKKSKLSK
ncbi:DNA excision repair protein ERCC-5 [Entomortierella parvispora]|uniref:DNA excision repair protein ERCC-5 n=1 Tax=Entomortierella parvispora TaxID=205924 RepID=A0A9P3LVV3_9FUNG|nr:DNA excision repair protein ERCC-5 [Entomortierella parvispora]